MAQESNSSAIYAGKGLTRNGKSWCTEKKNIILELTYVNLLLKKIVGLMKNCAGLAIMEMKNSK